MPACIEDVDRYRSDGAIVKDHCVGVYKAAISPKLLEVMTSIAPTTSQEELSTYIFFFSSKTCATLEILRNEDGILHIQHTIEHKSTGEDIQHDAGDRYRN